MEKEGATMHKFSINKPQNVSAMVSKASSAIRSDGGAFSGNEQSGFFCGDGVEGTYSIGKRICITITKKPFIFSNAVVESHIREFFASGY